MDSSENSPLLNENISNLIINASPSTNGCINVQGLLRERYDDWTTYPIITVPISILYGIVFFVGFFGNTVVVAAVIKFKALQTVRNMFIFGLSCSDFLSLFFAVTTTPVVAVQKNWYLGSFLCHFVPLIQGMCLCFSTFTLVSIAVDRYILILHPTKPPITKSIATKILVLNCFLAFILALPVAISHETTNHSNDGTPICGEFCSEHWKGKLWFGRATYSIIYSLLAYLIPLVIIAFSYIRIMIVLMDRAMKKAASTRIYDKSESSALLKMAAKKATAISKESIWITRQRRTNRMLMSMVVVFGLCWVPYITINSLLDFASAHSFTALLRRQGNFFSLIAHLIAVTTTVWNPFIYAFLNEQFREAFKQVLGTCFKEKNGRTVFRHRSLLLKRESHSTMRFNEFFGSQTSRMVSSLVSTEGRIKVERLSSLKYEPVERNVHFAEARM